MRLFYLARIDVEEEGASKRHVVEFCKSFASLGHEVTLFVPDLGARPRFEGFNTVYVRSGSRRPAVTFFSFYIALFFILLKNHIAGQRPDVVYTRHQQMEWLATWLRFPLKFLYAIEVNGLPSVELRMAGSPHWWIGICRFLERYVFLMPHILVTSSPQLKDIISRDYHLNPAKFFVIANGTNHEVFHPVDRDVCRKQLKLDPEANYLIYIGSLQIWHSPEKIIEVLPELQRFFPGIHLLIVGDGPRRPHLEKIIAEMDLSGRVTLAGKMPYEEVATYVNAADIGLGCFVEKPGISPLKIFDYMGCGKPIVADGVGGVEELILQYDLGVLVESQEARAWVKPILELLRNPERMRRYGENGRRAVLEKFSWRAITENVANQLVAMGARR